MSNADEQLIRDFYTARARRDMDAVRTILTDDISWHEPGEEDYSGDHHGKPAVVALLEKLQQVTGDTFTLEPTEFIVTAEHVATRIRWTAQRGGTRVDGNEIAVYRIRDGQIAEAWFFVDGVDPDALRAVFSYSEDQPSA